MIDLKELEAKARAATPGKWSTGQWTDPAYAGPEFQVFCDELEVVPVRDCTIEADAEYIASANPQTMLALLKAHDVMKRALEWYAHEGSDDRGERADKALAEVEKILKGEEK